MKFETKFSLGETIRAGGIEASVHSIKFFNNFKEPQYEVIYQDLRTSCLHHEYHKESNIKKI